MNLKRFLILKLMQTKIYKYFLKNIVPYIRFSMYYPKLRGIQFEEIRTRILPCDIILTVDKRKLTSFLIPGEFSHAAFFLGFRRTFEVAEMTHEDYTKSFLFDVCKQSDRVLILRCKDIALDPHYGFRMIHKCLSFQNTKYDSDFSLGVEALYCSELIYQSDFEKRIKYDLSDLAGIGQPYISPDGLLQAHNCYCVYDSDGIYTGHTGKKIEQIKNMEDKK